MLFDVVDRCVGLEARGVVVAVHLARDDFGENVTLQRTAMQDTLSNMLADHLIEVAFS